MNPQELAKLQQSATHKEAEENEELKVGEEEEAEADSDVDSDRDTSEEDAQLDGLPVSSRTAPLQINEIDNMEDDAKGG